MGYGWPIAESFEVVHDVPHLKTTISVECPVWAHRISYRREAKIQIAGDPHYGGMSISEAERIHDALGKAIAIAKTLKLEKPTKETK